MISGVGGEQSAIKEAKTPPLPSVNNKSQTESGMVPVMFVSWRVKAVILKKVPNASGTVPVNKLSWTCKNSNSFNT